MIHLPSIHTRTIYLIVSVIHCFCALFECRWARIWRWRRRWYDQALYICIWYFCVTLFGMYFWLGFWGLILGFLHENANVWARTRWHMWLSVFRCECVIIGYSKRVEGIWDLRGTFDGKFISDLHVLVELTSGIVHFSLACIWYRLCLFLFLTLSL